jgi:hypothetical protein
MRLTIGIAADQMSTAWPPSLGSGARSRMVMLEEGRNVWSQNARLGPAMPDPTIRTFMGVGWVDMMGLGEVEMRWGECGEGKQHFCFRMKLLNDCNVKTGRNPDLYTS